MQELPAVMEPIESRSAAELEEVVLPAWAAPSEPASGSRGGYGWWLLGTAAALAAAIATVTMTRGKGSAQEGPAGTHRDSGPATIRVVKPELRDMISPVGQPGFVEAYEQTALFSKVSGFIKKFSVDIGDEVKQDQVLCEIMVPELVQEHEQKLKQIEFDESMVKQAQQLVEVAKTEIKTAKAERRRRRRTWENIGRRSSAGTRNSNV